MPTLAERLAQAAERLATVTETPRLDAEILLAHALRTDRAKLLAQLRESVDAPEFEGLLERRLNHEPLAYILGTWEFFSLDLEVKPPLLVPRPETEHVVESALEHIGTRPAQVLDLCTGTGCIAIAIAVNAPNAHVVATDLNPEAVAITAQNARRHKADRRVSTREGDLLDALNQDDGPFDVIVANPPYVEEGDWESLDPVIRKHEDRAALLAGPDGLAVIRRIVSESPLYLKPGGRLVLEVGLGQNEAVRELLRQNGFDSITTRQDLAGIERIVTGLRAAS
jgi:release factor glutamine methyltransferase